MEELSRLSAVDVFIEASSANYRGEIKAEEVYKLVQKYPKFDFEAVFSRKVTPEEQEKLLELESLKLT